jgi:uncharacterized protein with HEPN domain
MAELADILDDLALLISRVEQSITNRTYDDLVANAEAYDALTYRLAMIGETCKKQPDDVKARHPEVPWREMATFRNFASHDYFGIDGNLVWKAALGLDEVKAMMANELFRLSE